MPDKVRTVLDRSRLFRLTMLGVVMYIAFAVIMFLVSAGKPSLRNMISFMVLSVLYVACWYVGSVSMATIFDPCPGCGSEIACATRARVKCNKGSKFEALVAARQTGVYSFEPWSGDFVAYVPPPELGNGTVLLHPEDLNPQPEEAI